MGAETTNPPNLRIQPAVHGPSCVCCVSLVGSLCTRYQVDVQGNAECDSFESIFLKRNRQFAEP